MTQLGKYELHEIIGRGGFGTVYRAIDTSLGREVAVKVLHPQLMVDETFVERFKKEARVLAALDHPNIVSIYELGEIDGRIFIVMRYLSGGSLQARIRREENFAYEEISKIMGQVCEGLQAAHEQGMVHRDLKPENILFDSRGNAVISDFGLAKIVQMSGASSSLGVVGTPAYRAPELWRGTPPASPATDVYSLGCIFVEMLTGKVLFDGETPDEVITQHLVDGPQLPVSYPSGVPDGVGSVIEKALAKTSTERYPSVAEFEQALSEVGAEVQKPPEIPHIPEIPDEGILKPPPVAIHKPRPGLWLAAGGGLALILLLIIGGLSGWFNAKVTAAPSGNTEGPSTTDAAVMATGAPAETLAPTETQMLEAGSTMVSHVDGMTLVYVPAGEFPMGSPSGVGESDEHPQHQVYLDAYWIDQTEVTNAMYEKCVNDGDCTEPSSNSSYIRDSYYGDSQHDDYPVIYVNWNQAQDYCEWAGRELPTEAQWEKAARGTDGRIYPWGDGSPNELLANFAGIFGDTTEVGSFPDGASPYGVLDMAGNVWEWAADWSGDYPSGKVSNPTGPSAGDSRVLRGGSWDYNANNIRSAGRGLNNPSKSNYVVGFRCVFSQN